MPTAENNTNTADTIRSTARGVVRGHVVATVRILREHLADPWTLDSLADEAHVSRSQLVRAFDATVGMSPMTYLRQMRVERMARLLASTDLSVAEVARSVGWTDANYASRCFHAHYGIAPTQFRQRQAPPPVR
jgi:AraC family transcriptional regulator